VKLLLTDEELHKAYTDAITMNLDMSFIKLLLNEIQERKIICVTHDFVTTNLDI
jgi:hypothetical protein